MIYMFLSMKPCQYLASDFLVLGLGTFLATYVDVISAPPASQVMEFVEHQRCGDSHKTDNDCEFFESTHLILPEKNARNHHRANLTVI